MYILEMNTTKNPRNTFNFWYVTLHHICTQTIFAAISGMHVLIITSGSVVFPVVSTPTNMLEASGYEAPCNSV